MLPGKVAITAYVFDDDSDEHDLETDNGASLICKMTSTYLKIKI